MSGFDFLRSKSKKTEDFPQRLQGQDGPSHAPIDTYDESNWLISYADMMTLLCVFFIMLFTMTKLDQPQYEKVKESVAKKFGGDYKSPSDQLARFMNQIINEAGLTQEAVVKSDYAGVSIVFQSTLFFDTLSAEIREQGQEVLRKLIDGITSRQNVELKEYKIIIEGHTDSRPILGGIFPSNWELSGSRAARVVRMFLEQGFKPEKLMAIGYADTRPEYPSRTPAGEWDQEALAKNRRVVVRILEPKIDSIPFPDEISRAPTSEIPDSIPPAFPENSAH